MNRFCLALLACASLYAQPVISFSPLPQLRDFLQLSDAQINTMLRNNSDYNTWLSGKQSRISQVQIEIAQETARDTIDPNALGVRYAEIEGICRQTRDKLTDLKNSNLSVLTDAQKAKLKILEDAMKLAPVISQAQSVNLLDGPTTGVFSFLTSAPVFTGTSGIGSFLLGTPSLAGCTTALPTAVVRTGDFR